MYEQAKYFRNRFIRNGIGGIILFLVMAYSQYHTKQSLPPTIFILIIIPLFFLIYGLWLKKMLKNKVAAAEDVFEQSAKRFSSKQINYVFRIVGFVVIWYCIRHDNYSAYIIVPFLLVNFIWMYFQMRQVHAYLKSNEAGNPSQ